MCKKGRNQEQDAARVELSSYATPFKLGRPVVQGSGIPGRFDAQGVDCPFVFRHRDRFCMMYVGFDGIGYRTGLAESRDLVNWTFKGIMLDRMEEEGSKARWDRIGAAGSWIMLESDGVFDTPVLKKIDGRYWMVYHSYPEAGYEAGGARMGLAWCKDEELLEWNRLDEPVFTYEDGGLWEQGGLYKCCVIHSEGLYHMFYNAKNSTDWPWKEETGLAVSEDLQHWRRHPDNPLLKTKPDSYYSVYYSDPCLKYSSEDSVWLNFGFGFDGRQAQGALAWSENLAQWTQLERPWLPAGLPGQVDSLHAHKSSVIYWEGVLYHYYCACRPVREEDEAVMGIQDGGNGEFRCISVAASRPF